ncbi:neural cell adhesion molecule L1-like [Haliotis rufescens]|uniref:neural cell adhesion molecule L1-like n=1 Tax=Haliotis rufescens TaxID=6454 RepID=UPI00201F494D|nr:neural cell adhesion molecule L1-like [Haliotis rufescens]
MRKLHLKLTLIAITVYVAASKWDVPITKNVTEGQPVSLTCRDPPGGKISWFQNCGKKCAQISTDSRRQIDQEGTLHFSHVNVMDTALYKCSVSDGNTMKLGSPVQLNVKEGEAKDRVPTLLKSSGNTDAKVGKDVTLQCIFSARPAPTVSWFRNNANLKNTDGVSISGGSLTIRNVSEKDTGIYRCTGQNKAGSQSADFNLNVIDSATNKVTTTTRGQRKTNQEAVVTTDTVTVKPIPAADAMSSSRGLEAATSVVVVVVTATFLVF